MQSLFVTLTLVLFIFISCAKFDAGDHRKENFEHFVQLLNTNKLSQAKDLLASMIKDTSRRNPSLLIIDNKNPDILLNHFRYLNEKKMLSVPVNINKLKTFFSVTPGEKLLFNDVDIKYLRDMVCFKKISDRICLHLTKPVEKVKALNQWTFTQIPSRRNGLQKGYINALATYPFEILQRGFGLCDRKAWVLCTLLQQQGIDCNVVYLFNPKTGRSNHTIVNVFLDGRAVFVDPSHAIVFINKTDNTYIGINEVLKDPDLLASMHRAYRGEIKDSFRSTIFFLAAYPHAFLPRMQAVQRFFNKYSTSPPCIYRDLTIEVTRFAKLFSEYEHRETNLPPATLLEIPRKTYFFTLWDYPFRLLWNMRSYYNQNLQFFVPWLFSYKHARLLHLMGYFDDAQKEYELLLSNTKENQVLDDVTYFLALLHFDMGQYYKAAQLLKTYRQKGFTNWKTHAIFLLSQAYKNIGNNKKSKEYLLKIKDVDEYAVFTQ